MSNSSKSARDNRANQLNPIHPAYHQSRGSGPDEAQRMAELNNPTRDNRPDQLNSEDAVHAASPGESKASSTSSNPSPAKPE